MSEITKIKVGDKTYDISDGAAITAITLNGEAVPVEDGVARLEVSGGGDSRILTGMIAAEGGTVTLTGGLAFVVIDDMWGGEANTGGIYVCTNDYVNTVRSGSVTVTASGHDYTIKNIGMDDYLYIAIINDQTE